MVEEGRDGALGYITLICLTGEELKILTHDSFIYICIQVIIVIFFGGAWLSRINVHRSFKGPFIHIKIKS